MTSGAVATPISGLNKATVDALIAAGAYDASTGLVTLGVTSTGSGEVHFDLAAGIKFRIDGGSILTDITGVDLDDAAAHTVDIYVNDGTSDVQVATLSFATLASTAAGSGSLTIDLGTGLLGETSTVLSTLAPLENYLTVTDGSFEIRDADNVLLGTVNYSKTDSLQDLADAIVAAVPNVTASIIAVDSTFEIEILHNNREVLTFANDTGGVISGLNITNTGDGVFSANINGSASGIDDGSVTVNGRTVTATSLTTAEGLQTFYSGSSDLASIQMDFTTGLGARLFFSIDDMLAPTTGLIDSNISILTDQNTQNQQRVDDMTARLEIVRERLLLQFINLEVALARAETLRDTITQSFDALFNSQSS